MAILLAGALTAVLAVCAVAGLFILRTAGGSPEERIEPARSQQNGQARPRTTFTPLGVVPAACEIVSAETAARLVPNSTAQPHKGSETDDYSKCSWAELSSSKNRELSVELRGVGGSRSVQDAASQFQEESAADEEGEGLLPGQNLKHFEPIEGVGEQAYELFLTERFQGQGIVHAQVGNVLLTVSYGGGSKGSPLDQGTCLENALEAAKEAVEAVRAAAA